MTNDPATTILSRRMPIAIVIGLTLLSGLVHGYLDGRWSEAADLKGIGSKLKQMPKQCGDWTLIKQDEISDNAAQLLRCYGSSMAVYRNKDSGAQVTLGLLFGPRGPIAVHTPEICYSSVGTRIARDRMENVISTDHGKHRLWSVLFSRDPDPEPVLEVWYAWSDGRDFQAAKHPRIWMTENLYKIQLAGPPGNVLQQPCQDFMKSFLPHVNGLLQ